MKYRPVKRRMILLALGALTGACAVGLAMTLLGFAAGVVNVMRAAGVAPDRDLDKPT